MKKVIKKMGYTLFFVLLLVSCHNKGTDDDTGDVVGDPCDFTLYDIEPNSTTVINCVLDLNEETVSLPENVTFVYEQGGDIINGTLNFSGNNSIIDGPLLNQSLILGGTKPQLKDPVFNFNPSRWGIVEGITTSEIALNNTIILENMMSEVKALGGTTLKVDELDAYFEVSTVTSTTTNQNYYPSQEAINVPSDFSFKMTDNTHLRVQPNGKNDYVLLAIRDESNVRVEGGNLYGDRAKHDDSQTIGNSGHVIMIHGGDNVDIDGVRMVNGTGDGIDINSLNFTFQENYIPSNNIRITHCIFDNNRRNNMSITDGFDILIDGNTFLNAGADNPNSVGVRPGYAIDIEAVRGKENGVYIYYEKAYDITISNNIEKGSKHGAFIVAIGEKTTIKGNTTERGISIGDASEVKIIENTLTNTNALDGAAIVTGHPDSLTTYDNIISGNTITGYNTGIALYQRDTEVFNNTISDFTTGILPKNIKNVNIYKNTLRSDKDGSYGIFAHVTSIDNVNIYENDIITTAREGINIVMVNVNPEALNYTMTIKDNFFHDNNITIEKSHGINFTGNDSEYVSLGNVDDVYIADNSIHSSSNHGIEILNDCKNVTVTNNAISVSGNKQCIYQDNGTNIIINNNDCN